MIFKKINTSPKILKILKIGSISFFGFILFLYLSFLLILPNVINVNNFTPQINTQIEKQTGFKFSLINPKFKTTWRLGIKFAADNVLLKYPDDTDFLNLKRPSIEINLPTLIFKKLNLDKIYVQNANVKLVFTKNKNYTIEENINKITDELQKNNKENKQNNLPIEIKNINIDIQKVDLLVKDENISKDFLLVANNTKVSLSSLNGPLKLNSNGYLKAEGNKENFIDYNIKLQTKLPKQEQKNKNDVKIIDFFPDFNPLANLDTYNFHSKIDCDLKITELGEKFNAKGYFNIDEITLKINKYNLPLSYMKSTFNKNNINTKSKIYISKDELISANNTMNISKKSNLDLNIKSDKISLTNVQNLVVSILEMFAIKNDVKSASVKGYFNCDFNLKSDLKSVKSSGKLELQEANVKYPKIGLNLTQIKSLLDFNGNKISIKDTQAFLNGSKLAVSGTIDSKTNTDITVSSDPVKISDIIKLAKQTGILKEKDIKDYSFNNGIAIILFEIRGNFKNLVPVADIKLNNLAMLIKSLSTSIAIDKISIVAQPDKKNDFSAKANIQNFKANIKNPSLTINTDKSIINANSETLTIEPFLINLQGTKINTSGEIKNYTKNPEIKFISNGNINPQTILAFVPAQNRKYITYQGQMPFKLEISGTLNNINLKSDVTSNPKNHISIIDIKNIKGLENNLNADLNIKNNNIIINTISIISKNKSIADINGKILNINSNMPQFSSFNILIPQKLSLTLPALAMLSFDTDANLILNSTVYNPQISGNANISNLSYPDFKINLANTKLDFKKSTINAQAQGLKISDSDFNGNAEISSNFSKVITINSLDFNSNYINADSLLKLTTSLPNTQTTAGPTLPLIIKNGNAKITKLKSGTIESQNISFNFNLYNNLFTLSKIVATFADGNISADATYNIANTKVTIDAVGKSINAKKAASCFAGGSSIIMSGTANGISKINFRGNNLNQQMRTLNGQVIFDISNGQYGEAARFERFLHAGNLLSQSLLNWNINQTISAVTSRNTGEFKNIEGKISLSNGWANITSLESSGPNMSLYITGKYNLLTENSDIKVLGRISSSVVSILGPLGSFSLNKVVEKLPDAGLAILNTIKTITPTNPLFADINQSDISKIPPLSNVSNNSTSKDFQVLINGPLSKTTSIKSFKWANPQSTDIN